MPPIRLGATLKAAVLAGLLGGLALGLFHFVFTEPVIDKAIGLEQQFAAAQAEIVSRGQQKMGLLIGSAVLGAILGALFAGPYALFHSWLPGSGQRRKGMLLAALAYWSIALFPFLKYPANPPGVGEEESIIYRQVIFLSFVALSVLGTALAVAIHHLLGKAGKSWIPFILGGYLLYALALFLLMPPNPDPIHMPLGLLGEFRWLALAGLTLLWVVLGGTFLLLWRRFSRPRVPGNTASAG